MKKENKISEIRLAMRKAEFKKVLKGHKIFQVEKTVIPIYLIKLL